MKIARFVTLTLIAILTFTALAIPAPAQASPLAAKTASLTVNNCTGGVLYVSLSGPRSYSFAAVNQGKTTFSNIEPGKYTITVRSSACGGSLTYNKKLTGKETLKPFICRR